MVIVILAVLNTSQATLVKVTHSVNCLIWFMFNNIHIKNFIIIIRRQLNEKVFCKNRTKESHCVDTCFLSVRH